MATNGPFSPVWKPIPAGYLERTVTLDMLECTESGVWLPDTETGLV